MDKGIEAIREAVRRAPLTKPEGLSPEWQAYFDAVTPLHVAELIAALEQAQQEKSHLEYRLKNVQHAHLAADDRALKAERRVSELEKTLRGTEESLIAAVDQVAELEAASIKVVNLPDPFAIRSGHPINENERSVMIPKDGGNWFSRLDIEHALRVAGVKFEGGE